MFGVRARGGEPARAAFDVGGAREIKLDGQRWLPLE
jgi:hypothetical protein